MVEAIARSARRRRQRGTSVVEAAFVLPILLMIVFAIGDFGIAYARWSNLTNAVREGARVGVVFRSPCNAGAVQTQIDNTVTTFANTAGVFPKPIVVGVANVCAGTGTQLTVDAATPYDLLALGPFTGLGPTIQLRARTVMRNE